MNSFILIIISHARNHGQILVSWLADSEQTFQNVETCFPPKIHDFCVKTLLIIKFEACFVKMVVGYCYCKGRDELIYFFVIEKWIFCIILRK